MQQFLPLLRRARDIGAIARHLAFRANRVGAADRAACRHRESPRSRGTLGRHGFHDLRDDLARLLHEHGIALADVLALDLVLVVQGGPRDGRPGQLDRLQLGHRRELPGASDLHDDLANPCRRLLRGVLHRDGPARELRRRAGDPSERQLVDLDDHSVDLVVQRVTPAAELVECVDDFVDRCAQPIERVGA